MDGLEQSGYPWATQRLVGKLYAVGFSADGVGEEAHVIQWRVFFSDVVAFPSLPQAWALAHTGTASGSCIPSCLTWVVLPARPTIGRIHRSVARSFKPTKIVLSLYFTTHFLLSNWTVHPASVRTRIPNREAMDNSGTMCPTRVVGRLGSTMSHICVDITW